MSRALFDQQRVGVTIKGSWHKKLPGRSITDRVLRQPISIRRRRSFSDKSSPLADENDLLEDDGDTLPYRVAARSTLDSMLADDSEAKREEIKEALAQLHEPLQQYTILFGAMKEVDSRPDIGSEKKQALKNALNEMMTDLVNRDRNGVRKGLREGEESTPVATKLEAARIIRGVSTNLRDIRFKIGARAKGGVDEELTAMTMAKALLKNVGPTYVEEALNSVCSRLMPTLRTLSKINETAYALTMSDAMAFSIARAGFKIARDFKRELVDKTGILCKLHHVEVAVILLMAAEQGWGKGKALQLVNQLVELKDTEPLTKAKAYTLVRDALNMLPITAWGQEKLSSRMDLLEDMNRQVSGAHDQIPLLTTKAERREEEWRNLYAAGRAPTLTENN